MRNLVLILIPKQYCVRQSTSEFKDFAITKWNELSNLHLQPDTWDRLKAAMCERFMPPSYQCDLRKKNAMLRPRGYVCPELLC
jgi:hypothetical protein